MNDKQRHLLRMLKEGQITMKLKTAFEAFGVSDFTSALVDAAHVAAMKGFKAVDPLWEPTVMAVPKNDFKVNNLVMVEGMGRLDVKIEGEPYYEAKPTDKKETYVIARWGKLFGLSMEAYVNDITGELVKKFTRWGAASQNTLNRWRFKTMLDDNPTIVAGTNLFSGGNANDLGAGKALAQATLAEAIAKMANQTDADGEHLNIFPKFLIVHPDQADVAYRLTQSDKWIATTTANVLTGAKNWWKGYFQVIVAPWITTSLWYLIADPNIYPVFEMGFYQGRKEPEITIQGPDSDAEFFRDTRYSKCRIIFGGQIEDPRCYTRANV